MAQDKNNNTNSKEKQSPRPLDKPMSRKRALWITLGVALVVAAATAAAVWWWQNNQQQTALEELSADKDGQIESLEEQLQQAKDEVKTEVVEKTKEVEVPQEIEPVIVFNPPADFSNSEEDVIRARLVNPFKDYYKEQDRPLLAMWIEKSSDGTYRYGVDTAHKGGTNQGFLYGKDSPLEWWKPTCLGGCEFSDEYKQKYPKVVE